MSDTPDWLAGSPRETVQWESRPRSTTALPGVLVGALLVLSGVGLLFIRTVPHAVSLLPAALGAPIATYAYLRVRTTRYVVTDRACYRKVGVLSRDVRRLSRVRVQNSSFEQGVLAAVFGYGTVTVVAAGGGSISFSNVADPKPVRALVDRRESVPGSVAQWRAVREEVGALRAALDG